MTPADQLAAIDLLLAEIRAAGTKAWLGVREPVRRLLGKGEK